MGNSSSHAHSSYGGAIPGRQLSEIEQDLYGSDKCAACRNVEALIAYWTSTTDRAAGPGTQVSSAPQFFHNSFAELDNCAQRCVSCRVLRRALILQQPSTSDIQALWSSRNVNRKASDGLGDGRPLFAVLSGAGQHLASAPLLTIILGNPASPYLDLRHIARIQLSLQGRNFEAAQEFQLGVLQKSAYLTGDTERQRAAFPAITAEPPRLPEVSDVDSVYHQVRHWAIECYESHVECRNLAWSIQPPTRLLQISHDGQTVQLVNNDFIPTGTRYTALSYCWGQGRTSNTTTNNLKQRQTRPFPTSELPHTIRDAVRFTIRSGIEYIWIDSLCIVQDSQQDWRREAARMHEVYSNAFFTICAVAGDHADAGLFAIREAWRYKTEPSYLQGWRLAIASSPFAQVKSLAFWSTRGWTMQEELLSPRTIYCGPSGVFWSCCQAQHAEGEGNSASVAATAQQQVRSPAQSFLQATRSGHDLDKQWMDIVESYSARHLTNTSDRFLALSGVAARYQARKPQDLYMAGLWYTNIAQGLVWRVQDAVQRNPDRTKMHECPSWSWASLPIPTPVRISRSTTTTPGSLPLRSRFEVLHIDKDVGSVTAGNVGDAVASVARGSEVGSLTVKGRIRSLCSAASRAVPWASVIAQTAMASTSGADSSGTATFTFHNWLDQEVHSINSETGGLVTCQPRMQELVAQLDYLDSVDGILVDASSVTCLEISDRAMLLLAPASKPESDGMLNFTRVGVSTEFREDFFVGLGETVIMLS